MTTSQAIAGDPDLGADLLVEDGDELRERVVELLRHRLGAAPVTAALGDLARFTDDLVVSLPADSEMPATCSGSLRGGGCIVDHRGRCARGCRPWNLDFTLTLTDRRHVAARMLCSYSVRFERIAAP